MPIKGITHDEHGRVKQSLAVVTKVAIGLAPDEQEGRKAPIKLDHFVLLRKEQTGTGNRAEIQWVEDEELTAHFGENPRELGIVLIDDDIENIFPSEYAWWTKSEKVCWGDGETATRRTKEVPDGEEWPGKHQAPGCGPGCSDLEAGKCKPSADLYFWLADFPALGRVCRIHTSSYRSIRQIHSALNQIRNITGGRLTGIHAKLCVRPEKASYQDPKDGNKRKSTTIWALSLELDAENIARMIERMTETARLFDSTRKLLGGQVIEYHIEEPEPQKAPEIQAEFLPDNGNAEPSDENNPTEEGISPEKAALINRIKRAGKKHGLTNAQVQFEIGRHWEKLDAYLAELGEEAGSKPQAPPSEPGVEPPTSKLSPPARPPRAKKPQKTPELVW